MVVREFGKISVETLKFLPPGPGEVRVRVHACGLCQSDVASMTGKLGGNPLPFVLGHEGAGVIESVGPSAAEHNFKVGDHVVLVFSKFCGKCDMCVRGSPHLCLRSGDDIMTRYKTTNLHRVKDSSGNLLHSMLGLGCMADYAIVSANAIVKIDPKISFDKAALVGCGVTTGVGAVFNKAKVFPGATCCVIGCGGVGLNAIQGCRISGASQIIAVDALPSKLEAAKSFGATHVINAKVTLELDLARVWIPSDVIGLDDDDDKL